MTAFLYQRSSIDTLGILSNSSASKQQRFDATAVKHSRRPTYPGGNAPGHRGDAMKWADSIGRDVRMGVRMLGKNPTASSAAFVSLSLAVGACVAAFSLVDALILRALPVRDPGQLVYLAFPTYTVERPESDTFNDPVFVRMRDAARGQADLFAMSTHVVRRVVFAGAGGDKEPVRTQFVSGDAFEILGILPAAGR